MRNAFRTVIAIMIAAGLLGAMGAAFASSSEEQDFLSRVNRERTNRGLRAFSLDAGLSNVARNHSQEMASQNSLHHNSNLGNEVSGWRELGENVGNGGDVEGIHVEFMRSAAHRDEILYANYTKIGVGTVWFDGTLWVTQVFFRPAETAPAPKATSTTARASRPRATTRRAAPVLQAGPAPAPARPEAPIPAPPPTAPVAIAVRVISSARLEKLLGDLPVAGAADAVEVGATAGLVAAAQRTSGLGSVLWQYVDRL